MKKIHLKYSETKNFLVIKESVKKYCIIKKIVIK